MLLTHVDREREKERERERERASAVTGGKRLLDGSYGEKRSGESPKVQGSWWSRASGEEINTETQVHAGGVNASPIPLHAVKRCKSPSWRKREGIHISWRESASTQPTEKRSGECPENHGGNARNQPVAQRLIRGE
jgi:hypothetical protein